MSIQYEQGYKYQLHDDYSVQLDFRGHAFTHEFIALDDTGLLTIRAGYAWDGASGIAIDTGTIMRGALVHDCLYQALRLGYLPSGCFHQANKELRRLCLEDGMWKVRAWWVFKAVEGFGSAFAALQPDKILTAP